MGYGYFCTDRAICVHKHPMKTKIKTQSGLLRVSDSRCIKMLDKRVDPELTTPEHRAWAYEVKRRAGFRCEAVDQGQRCRKSLPNHRLFADHIIERKDGGDRYDPKNGQCLCGSHHSTKTYQARADRMRQTFTPSDKGQNNG